MTYFIFGFLTCAILDLAVLVFWRNRFVVALNQLDALMRRA